MRLALNTTKRLFYFVGARGVLACRIHAKNENIFMKNREWDHPYEYATDITVRVARTENKLCHLTIFRRSIYQEFKHQKHTQKT